MTSVLPVNHGTAAISCRRLGALIREGFYGSLFAARSKAS
jgi:hypothetical protein